MVASISDSSKHSVDCSAIATTATPTAPISPTNSPAELEPVLPFELPLELPLGLPPALRTHPPIGELRSQWWRQLGQLGTLGQLGQLGQQMNGPARLLLATLPLAGMVDAGPALAHSVSQSVSRPVSLPIAQSTTPPLLLAQSITPTHDGTGTVVERVGDRYDIRGGSLSRDGQNLFHNFERFGLNANEVANFLSNPQIDNILGRVSGGDPSVINGLLRVSGGDANLYLINPAGIIFGRNARLDVPGSFTATTATGVGFNDQWLEVMSSANYGDLVGAPSQFEFATAQPGAVVNAGTLTVGSGQGLTLLGGTVVNTGTLTAPGGQITIAAVPGESRVRLSQPNSLLSLEVEARSTGTAGAAGENGGLVLPTARSLPELLTGGAIASATGITVNPDGTVRLSSTATAVPVETGTAIVAGQVNAANLAAVPGSTISPPETLPETPPEITILGDRVALLGARLDARSVDGGGVVRVGGDYQGQGTLPRADITYVSGDSQIDASAVGQGDGGRVIVWADDTTRMYGAIAARGGESGGNGGLIETSGKISLDTAGSRVDASAPLGAAGVWLLDPLNLTVDATATSNATTSGVNPLLFTPSGSPSVVGVTDITNALQLGTSVSLTTLGTGGAEAGDIIINAPITVAIAPGNSATLTLTALNNINLNQNITNTGGALNLVFQALNNINLNADVTVNGGDVNLTANGDSNAAGGALFFNTMALSTNGGSITGAGTAIISSGAGVSVNSSTINAGGGDIALTGTGTAAATGGQGVLLQNGSLLQTAGVGAITLTGQVGGNSANAAVAVTTGSTVSTVNGGLTIAGTDSSTGSDNTGILVGTGSLRTAGTGAIALNGTSTATGTGNSGVRLATGSTVEATGSGAIALTGTAPGGNQGAGIFHQGTLTTTSGAINLTGTATGTGTDSSGVAIAGGTISSGNGSIRLNGSNSATGNGNRGLLLDAGATVNTTGSGGINLVGSSSGAGSSNEGISLLNASEVEAAGSGAIQFEGRGVGSAAGITLTDSTVNSSGAGTGAVLFSADEINFLGTSRIDGSGALRLQARTANLDITLGGTTTDSRFNLSTSDLEAIQSGFSQMAIGRSGESVDITQTGDASLNNPITLTANRFDHTAGTLFGSAPLTLRANRIRTGSIVNSGQAITLISGTTITTTGLLDTSATDSDGGAVTLRAGGDIRVGQITTNSNRPSGGSGGDITLLSRSGRIQAGNLTTNALISGGLGLTGGDIQLDANGPITAALLDSRSDRQGGGINLTSRTGAITVTGSTLTGQSSATIGGDVVFSARGPISAQDVFTGSSAAQGGAIALTSSTGDIATGDLTSAGRTGGQVTVNAATAITTGVINSSGSVGSGGDITLDPTGDIQVTSINAQGGDRGQGGTVDITTDRFFRATGTFSDRNQVNASISTAGGRGGGSITIRHGGRGVTPFDVGSATTNGTAGTLTSGTFAIAPPESFPYTFVNGNISLITAACPPPCGSDPRTDIPRSPQTEVPPPLEIPQPHTPGFESPTEPGVYYTLRSLDEAQEILSEIERATGVKPALIYVGFVPAEISAAQSYTERESDAMNQHARYVGQRTPATDVRIPFEPQDSDRLEVLMITADGEPIVRQLPGITRAEVLRIANQFRGFVTNPRITTDSNTYLPLSQQLYQWILAPLQADLEERGIDNLGFVMDGGLRSLPVAALHDGNGYLIERYSVGLMPSISLIDTTYVDIRNAEVLAMGASEFSDLPSLPAVPSEISLVTQAPWHGEAFLNPDFTLDNLIEQRRRRPFGIVHLATHGEFRPGQPDNSFIQLWDQTLKLDQLRELGLNNPPVELLVLSACRTAIGDDQAELGFAGLALQAGVKSALASLWYVSDQGTLAFMTEFYRHLHDAPIKAEAVRRTQLAMLHGEVRLENGQLITSTNEQIALPSQLNTRRPPDLSHPFYWSAFTMIGSPW